MAPPGSTPKAGPDSDPLTVIGAATRTARSFFGRPLKLRS